jgi:hypothetical protein
MRGLGLNPFGVIELTKTAAPRRLSPALMP